MRPITTKLSFLVILLYLTACTKKAVTSNQNQTPNITGKWSLVTDSTFEGVGTANHPVDYTGEGSDYFIFNTDGSVHTKEGNVPDTLVYQLLSNDRMVISQFGLAVNGVTDTCTVSGLTAANGLGLSVQFIYIESPRFLTPGGAFWRKVTLRRNSTD
jgi:hypothetical protein